MPTFRRFSRPAVTRDLYQEVTDKIVAAIEAGARKWVMPWHKIANADGAGSILGGGFTVPVNIKGQPYHGINVLLLWAEQASHGYRSNVWGTYDGFKAFGAQVRKGEKSSFIVFYKKILDKKHAKEHPGAEPKFIPLLRSYPMFNADQVDGYTPVKPAETVKTPVADTETGRLPAIDEFLAHVNIAIDHGGNRACYIPMLDMIKMPTFGQFRDAASYYATRLHEMAHATGHKSRLNRDLNNRFGSEAYAAEELIAELAAAFLCVGLGIDNEPRPDHAQYLTSWLRVLKNDKRAIFTAAKAAQQAADWLITASGATVDETDETDETDADELPLAA